MTSSSMGQIQTDLYSNQLFEVDRTGHLKYQVLLAPDINTQFA